jgi:hypothetical protein
MSRVVSSRPRSSPISPPCRAGREARAVSRLHQPKHTSHCVDAATNANDPRHLCFVADPVGNGFVESRPPKSGITGLT